MNNNKSYLIFRRDFISTILALFLAFSSIVGFVHVDEVFYYGSLGFIGLFTLYKGHLKNCNNYILLFFVICAFSLLFNDPPSYFRAWERLGVYVIVLIIISPIIISKYSTKLKANLFLSFWQFCAILSVCSYFAYFLGINFFVRKGSELDIGVGTFSGLMNHSMTLGPIAALSFIYLLQMATTHKSYKRIVFVIASIFCLGACFLSASRAAVGSAIIGVIFMFYRIYKGKLSKMVILGLFFAGLTAIIFSMSGDVTDLVIKKQERNEIQGGTFYSRNKKYTARLIEFQSRPIIGIGYNTINPLYDYVNPANGQIEPGSSWLAVLSMTGIIGLICFVFIIVRAIKKIMKLKDVFWSSMLGGMLVFFVIHMIAEGYIFAPHSIFACLFWLILSLIDGIFDIEQKTLKNHC